MDKQFFKKITCQSPEDLPYISALVSEGKIKSGEIKYLPKNKIFLLLAYFQISGKVAISNSTVPISPISNLSTIIKNLCCYEVRIAILPDD